MGVGFNLSSSHAKVNAHSGREIVLENVRLKLEQGGYIALSVHILILARVIPGFLHLMFRMRLLPLLMI
ncbi:MAG: hypothetical protein DDT32_01593 [Syntrophomonadaceae bacterium]|nr:hypothetical protein [Bacillota bacterium]MBT9147827.1 hypothetical protein [Bacillota bacterium]